MSNTRFNIFSFGSGKTCQNGVLINERVNKTPRNTHMYARFIVETFCTINTVNVRKKNNFISNTGDIANNMKTMGISTG